MKKNTPKPSPSKNNADSFSDPAESLEAALLQTLYKVHKPLHKDALLRILKLPRRLKKEMDEILHKVQEKGLVVRAGGGWATTQDLKTVEGVLSIQRAGMGFVTPNATGKSDIYIHPANMGDAWHGDTVRVTLLPGKQGRNTEGRISEVIHRALQELPALATQRQKNGDWMCVPSNPRIQAMFSTDTSSLARPAERDDLLLIVPGEKIGPNLWQARATANLEHEETATAQERLTKSNHAIPHAFPPTALAESAHLPEAPAENEFSNRHDLRDLDFVTIDGHTARDFDDAILVEGTPKGFRLRVAIADVAHYVPEGSALDNEARLRGNSYYFPLSVEPMLPEALSNGLCSLRPRVPRLAMVADMDFSLTGTITRAEFYAAVIESSARLTYGQIQRALLLHEPEERERVKAVLPMLEQAEKLARILAKMREERGSLDFDLPEAEIIMDERGNITRIAPRERHFGHRLIEEFMIAANEAVARFLKERGVPFLYRTHPAPEAQKLASLLNFLLQTGLAPAVQQRHRKNKTTPTAPTTLELLQIMQEAAGSPQEYTVNRLVLRSMMQAQYTPEHDGHFGLASTCYCHFTSPIRRYADLIVHRALRDVLGIARKTGERRPSIQRLEQIADHINGTERTAMEAEREIQKRLTILYLRDKVNDEYDGIISGITDFGMFVELPSLLAEGMVRLSSLSDDYYEYLPERHELRGKRTSRTFHLGQKLTVRLTDVNLARLEVNLILAENMIGAEKNSARPGRKISGLRAVNGLNAKRGKGRAAMAAVTAKKTEKKKRKKK